MSRGRFHPADGAEDEFLEHRHAETPTRIARRRPNHTARAGSDHVDDAPEKGLLLLRREVMQHVEDDHVAALAGMHGCIADFEFHVVVSGRRGTRALDLRRIGIKAVHGQCAAVLAEIAGKKSDPAANIKHRPRRTAQPFKGRGIGRITAQLAPRVTLQPAARIPPGDVLDRLPRHRMATRAGS